MIKCRYSVEVDIFRPTFEMTNVKICQNYLIFKTLQTALLKSFIIKYFNNKEKFHISNQQQRSQTRVPRTKS